METRQELLEPKALVWISNPMLFSQKQLGQTFQIGKVEKNEKRAERQIPRLKLPQKEGLAAEWGSLVCVTEWGQIRDAPASPGLMPLFPGSLAGWGHSRAAGAQPFRSLLEWLSFHVSQRAVRKGSFGKRAGKPLAHLWG